MMKKAVEVIILSLVLSLFPAAASAAVPEASEPETTAVVSASDGEGPVSEPDTEAESTPAAEDLFAEDSRDAGEELSVIPDAGDESPSRPLFQFYYGGKTIKTYASFSTIGDKLTTSHRYFVKNGKLTVIDQSMDPTPTGVFIHYDEGKSYIVVLCEDGKIQSLGTEDVPANLDGFQNSGIRSMNENITTDSNTLLFEYDDGGIAAYNCVTGEKIYQKDGVGAAETGSAGGGAVSFVDHARNFISGILDSIGAGGDSSQAASDAQEIVEALTDSGLTLEELTDKGGLPGLDFGTPREETSRESSPSAASAADASDASDVPAAGIRGQEILPQDIVGSTVELTVEEQTLVGSILAKVLAGQESPEEAAAALREAIPELTDVQEAHIREQLEKVLEERSAEVRASMAAEETEGSGDAGTPESAEGTDGTEETEEGTDPLSPVKEGAVPEDHAFITSRTGEEYVAVFNAKEGRYDIYSVDDLLENPADPESELDKISDKRKTEVIVRLLTSRKDTTVSRGIILYVSIAAAICGIIALMLIFGRKKNVPEKQKAE